jgi:hypothetical protein
MVCHRWSFHAVVKGFTAKVIICLQLVTPLVPGAVAAFVRASNLQQSRSTLTTGYASLDGLMNGLRGGQLYLICGETPFLDHLIHRLIVRGAMEGKVAYMNNTDYYHEKTLLRTDLLAFYAKKEGVPASLVLNNVYTVTAYSEFRQPKAADALKAAVEGEPSTVVVVVHNVSTFTLNSENRPKAFEGMNYAVSLLWHLALERDLIMITTVSQNTLGSGLLADLANVAVSLRENGAGIRAVLLKHPEKPTPVEVPIFSGGDFFMGRITPPFRQTYQETLEQLRSNYVALLRDPTNRKGFDLLLREAWDREHAAMGNSELPLVLDALNLTANVHNSGAIAEMKETATQNALRIESLEARINRIEAMLASPDFARRDLLKGK